MKWAVPSKRVHVSHLHSLLIQLIHLILSTGVLETQRIGINMYEKRTVRQVGYLQELNRDAWSTKHLKNQSPPKIKDGEFHDSISNNHLLNKSFVPWS